MSIRVIRTQDASYQADIAAMRRERAFRGKGNQVLGLLAVVKQDSITGFEHERMIDVGVGEVKPVGRFAIQSAKVRPFSGMTAS